MGLTMISDKKKIVVDVGGWFRVYDDGSVDRSELMIKLVAPHENYIDGVATRDVIANQSSGLSVRIYLPERKPQDMSKLPVILHFHGGGFCITKPDWSMYYAMYGRLARTAPAICVSVRLRRAPEHRLPAPCDDGYNALLWLKSLALGTSNEPWLSTHADFSRVFLVGDSSGGNIVHSVAARAGKHELGPLRLVGCIPIQPGFVRSEHSKSESAVNESSMLTVEMMDKFLSLALPHGSTKDHPITYPMGPNAPAIDGLILPPFLLVVAQKDLMRDTQMEYFEAMKKAGKDVQLLVNEGVTHGFYFNKRAVDMDPHTRAQAEILFSGITDFIKSH